MPTVFLVDDDDGVRQALERALSEEGFEVHACKSAQDFLAIYRASPRGCVVLDVSMPDMGGLELQAELAACGKPPPIVFLTGHGDIPMAVKALKRGAADFLPKPTTTRALVAAISDALAKDEAARRADSAHAQILACYGKLTAREREVLAAVVSGKINKQIADELGVVEQTIKFHRARIMERMQAKTTAELIYMAARLEVGADGTRSETRHEPLQLRTR